ncbi:MAG: hypothetical protein JRH19_04995 [Deltaproteobacteria bacterium]|nr:hypothetical protein [Deltaproteobacteria bacterium]
MGRRLPWIAVAGSRGGIACALLLACFASGCTSMVSVKLYNNSDSVVRITAYNSTHTVGQGDVREFGWPSRGGEFEIANRERVLRFRGPGMEQVPEAYCSGPGDACGLRLQLDSDRLISILLPRQEWPIPRFASQPLGFPLAPREAAPGR